MKSRGHICSDVARINDTAISESEGLTRGREQKEIDYTSSKSSLRAMNWVDMRSSEEKRAIGHSCSCSSGSEHNRRKGDYNEPWVDVGIKHAGGKSECRTEKAAEMRVCA